METSRYQKGEISNSVRLESIKRRKHEKTSQEKYISNALNNLDSSVTQNKKIVFDSDAEEENSDSNTVELKSVTNKITLFESSASEDEDYEERFKIKKQFEGEKGKQLFEMSAHCTDDRFKLDERFEENDDGSNYFMPSDKNLEEKNEPELEKEKNLEILEKVLGFQVPRKYTSDLQKTKKKTYVRFDPESDNAGKYIIKQDEVKSKDKKKDKKQNKNNEETSGTPEQPIVSSERFFEVTTNLKELLNTSDKQFSLGNQFSFAKTANKEDENEDEKSSTCESSMSDDLSTEGKLMESNKDISEKQAEESFNPIIKEDNSNVLNNRVKTRMTFFMQADDEHLKEGVNFFHWNKSLDAVREKWPAIRNELLEAYKKNRKGGSQKFVQKSRNFKKLKRSYK